MAHADDLADLDALDLALTPFQRLSAAILNRCVLDWRQRMSERGDVLRFLRSGWGVVICAQVGTDPGYIERRLMQSDG